MRIFGHIPFSFVILGINVGIRPLGTDTTKRIKLKTLIKVFSFNRQSPIIAIQKRNPFMLTVVDWCVSWLSVVVNISFKQNYLLIDRNNEKWFYIFWMIKTILFFMDQWECDTRTYISVMYRFEKVTISTPSSIL